MSIGKSICIFVIALISGACPLWAIAGSARSDMGLTLTEPPEPRVVRPKVDMPENVMARKNIQEIEIKKHHPVKDLTGKIQYLVTFTDSAPQRYAAKAVRDARFADWHDGKVIQLLQDIEAKHQFSATHVFSLTMQGFAAFLTPQQISNLRRDPRIKQLNQSIRGEFSGAIWSDVGARGWGIQAVGGGKTSSRTATVYVVDSGISPHFEYNLIDSWAAPGACLIGRYSHSTFVAGIIGAAGNGVTGVDALVSMVSLAYGDNTCVADSQTTPNVVRALEEAKRRIQLSGRVGVVNLSSNFVDPLTNTFPADLKTSIRGLIAPNFSTGYRGAFFVQSAGNGNVDACNYSFNDNNPSDGAMVIGAIDNNGQPVQPINGEAGFNQGSTLFGGELGSNYGACVDVWAPGKKITSTWSSNSYAKGDGTSFAAPHIAGIAAYLIEAFPATIRTPADVENAVRARMVGYGAFDLQNRAVRTANIDSIGYSAKPTVEFKIGTNPSDAAPQPIGQGRPIYSTDKFHLSYDSIGAQLCDLRGYVNGNLWYQVLNFQKSYDWGDVQLNPDQYRWDVTCRSPTTGLINTSSAYATVTAPPPTASAAFLVNGDQAINGETKVFNYGQQPFLLAYNSTNTTNCTLTGYNTPLGGFLNFWYQVPNFYPSFNWGPVLLDVGYYHWTIDCAGPNGEQASSSLYMYIL